MEGYFMVSSSSSRRVPRTAISLACLFALMPGLASAQGVQQVNVTATRFSDAQDALPFGVSVLTSEQLRASGVRTVNEALMKLLGIPGRQDSFGQGDSALDLRGFGATADNNQVIVVDGVRISEADTSGTRVAGINIDTIERIEVIRGSAAVLYGEGATAGVISITTKAGAGTERNNTADLYAATGSHRMHDLRGAATMVSGGFSVDLAANQQETDNHRDNFHAKTDGYSVTGQWRADGIRLGARLAQDQLDARLPGSLTLVEFNNDPRHTNNWNDYGSLRNTRYGVFASGSMASWEIILDAGWREKSLDSATTFRGAITPTLYAYDVEANNQALRAKRSFTWGAVQHAVATGIDLDQWKRNITIGFVTGIAQQRSRAFYVKDDILLTQGTRLSAGVRSSWIDKSDAAGNVIQGQPKPWELGITQPLGQGWSVYGRFGRSFRYPAADEYNFPPPVLVPQDSRDVELGARWGNRSSRTDVRVYRSTLNHEIAYDPTVFANVNLDRTRRQGVELEASQRATAAVQLRLNGAIRQSKFIAGAHDGKEVPLAPKASAAVHVDWEFLPQHRLDAGISFVGSQHPGSDFANECKMPAYSTADVRYAYRVGTVELAVAVSNLTDKRYFSQAYGCNGGITDGIYPDPGRAAVASLRWSFF
jgi:iron complex outermembrane receptor protein